jgi:hypothetical protein
MRYLKYFEQTTNFDYDYILRILKKNHGWGNGSANYFDNFENNEEYFLKPQDSNEYADQFHIFLTDLTTGRLRGEFHKTPSGLRTGKWKMSIPVYNPISIYNRLT